MNELIAYASGMVANAITSNTCLVQAAVIYTVRMIADMMPQKWAQLVQDEEDVCADYPQKGDC